MTDKNKINLTHPTYSESAQLYALHRPTYSKNLYSYIRESLTNKSKAWDVACGTGQVSIELSKFMKETIATDPSQEQINNAPSAKNLKYSIGSEKINAANNSFDLITCGTAIHWMNRDIFFKEVDRVLKPDGLLAIWGYTGIDLNNEIDNGLREVIFEHFLPYYPKNILIAFNKYEEISTPYKKIYTPDFFTSKQWTFTDFINYFYTFSAIQNLLKQKKHDELFIIYRKLHDVWDGEDKTRTVTWNLITHFSKKPNQ